MKSDERLAAEEVLVLHDKSVIAAILMQRASDSDIAKCLYTIWEKLDGCDRKKAIAFIQQVSDEAVTTKEEYPEPRTAVGRALQRVHSICRIIFFP